MRSAARRYVRRLDLTKSLRRALRRNADLQITIARQQPSAEKWLLYQRYQREWHNKTETVPEGLTDFIRFLYDSPVESVDFEYRAADGKLIGVGVCDISSTSISSVLLLL